MYYQLITNGCPSGYGFVRDYMGNKVFYGTIEECHDCLDDLNGWGWKHGKRKIRKGGDKNGSSESKRY